MKKALFFILILTPVFLVFKSLFSTGSLAYGDAPHFYPESLKELISKPQAWTYRGASFGGVNLLLWISPLMVLWGALYKFLSIGNDLGIRLIFYFPSVIFCGVGMYFLARHLKLSKVARFFAIFVYIFNTYFLLLVDGGQAGVALAYGIFPLAVLFVKKYIDSGNIKNFFVGLAALVLLGLADPRVAIICFLTIFLWNLIEFGRIKSLVFFVPLLFSWVAISAYWIVPLLKIDGGGGSLEVANLQFLSLLNPLVLFSPHWPSNLYGKINQPYFYFTALPVVILLGTVFVKLKKYASWLLVFLTFCFLVKGTNFPLGQVYQFLINLPFGFAFRDSSKFFAPVILFAGLMIGETIEAIFRKIKPRIIKNVFLIVSYLFLVFLIAPAIFGKMNFSLSSRNYSNDFERIYDNMKKDDGFFRTVWFTQRHPLTFETGDKQVVNAGDLVNLRPFAAMNAGEDIFNFLNNPSFAEWLEVLGVKYVVLSGDPRNLGPTEKDVKSWQEINNLIEKTQGLKKVNWGTAIPVYETKSVYPRFYTAECLIAVVGPDLLDARVPAIYFEDGKWDPRELEGKNSESVKLYFNGSDKGDLTMSFLQKYFVPLRSYKLSDWAVYDSAQYLKYKYELLIRGVDFTDFDYGRGIAFSTKRGEKMVFSFDATKTGEYVVATRGMDVDDGDSNLTWSIEKRQFYKGKNEITIEDKSGFEVLNTLAIIPGEEYEKAGKLADVFITHFGQVGVKELSGLGKINELDMTKSGSLKYKFATPEKGYWTIFSDNYHTMWNLRRGIEYFNSLPVFSAVNGFYFEPKWGDLGIEFKGQENVRWGMYLSAISILGLSIIFLWTKH